MPWCPRCGTGLSQMEMNEGYQDREDPGLTIRLPLIDRPGRGAAGLDDDAVDADLQRRRGGRPGPALRPGPPGRRRRAGSGKGTLKTALQGPFTVEERGRRVRPRRLALRGPFDELPGRSPARSPRPATSTASCLGRGRRGRGHRHRPHRARLRRGGLPARQGARLPVIGPIDEDGRYLAGFGWLTGLDAPRVAERIVDDLEQRGFFYHLEPYTHRYPHCWRCGTPLLFRLVDEWFISMGPVYDQPRETLTQGAGRRQPALPDHGRRRRDPLDPGLRLRPGARLAPQHARLDDQQEALLGPGAADLRLRGVRHVRGHRRARRAAASGRSRAGTRSRATRRTGRGSTRSGSPARRAARRSRGSRTSATRGWTPASCRSRRSTSARTRTTGRSGSRPTSSPRASPASSATGSTRCSRCRPCSADGAVQDDLRLRPRVRRGRPPDAQELGQRDRVRRGRRPDGRRRHALDVRQGPARGQHPVRLARGRRGAPRAARPVERVRVLRDLRPARRLDARAAGSTTRSSTPATRRRSTAGSCRARPAWPRTSARGWPTSTRSGRRGPSARSSTTCRPGTCAGRATGCAAAPSRRPRRPPSRRSTRRSSR